MNPKDRNPKNVFKKTRTLLPSTNKYQEKLSAKVKGEKNSTGRYLKGLCNKTEGHLVKICELNVLETQVS